MGDWNSFSVQQASLRQIVITPLVSGVLLGSACTQTPQATTDWVVVVAYDYSEDTTTDWRFLGPGWRILATEEGQVLEGHGPSSAIHPLHLRQPQLTLHVRLVEGSVTVGFLANIGSIVADIGLGHSHGDAGHTHGPFGHATLPIGRLQEELEGYALRVEADRLVLSTTPIASGAIISDVPFAFGLDAPRRLNIDIQEGALNENTASRTIRMRVDESMVMEAQHDIALCVLDDSCGVVPTPAETPPSGKTMGPPVYRGSLYRTGYRLHRSHRRYPTRRPWESVSELCTDRCHERWRRGGNDLFSHRARDRVSHHGLQRPGRMAFRRRWRNMATHLPGLAPHQSRLRHRVSRSHFDWRQLGTDYSQHQPWALLGHRRRRPARPG